MQIEQITSSHSISPGKVLRGENAWENGRELIPLITKRPLLLGRSKSTKFIRQTLFNDLKDLGINPIQSNLKYDCCELDLQRLQKYAVDNNCDGIIAAGGGKVLDSGKLLAHRLSIKSITIPLSASTCAGWTALSNIYSSEGAYERDVVLKNCPDLLIFDHKFIRLAPRRTLASGIADALAKWYEASLTSGKSNDGLVEQAVQMARVLRDQLFINAKDAFENHYSDSWIKVAEGCALTAGLIGGIGGSQCRTAVAHSIHNGLTQLSECKNPIHGEIVCFGILAQLRLEEIAEKKQLANQARIQLLSFLKDLELPLDLKSLGLDDLQKYQMINACEYVINECKGTNQIPIKLSLESLMEALTTTSQINETKTEKAKVD